MTFRQQFFAENTKRFAFNLFRDPSHRGALLTIRNQPENLRRAEAREVCFADWCSVLDDGREGFGIEACTANQGSIDFGFGHQCFRIVGLHRASVEDAEILS